MNFEQQSVTIKSSFTTAAGTVAGTTTAAVPMQAPQGGIVFMMDLTATLTDAGDTLDVYVQTKIGTQWVDIVHFTQALGNGNAKRFFGKISATAAEAMFENASALAASAVRNLIGDQYRLKYDITDANSNSAFTFSVVAKPF